MREEAMYHCGTDTTDSTKKKKTKIDPGPTDPAT